MMFAESLLLPTNDTFGFFPIIANTTNFTYLHPNETFLQNTSALEVDDEDFLWNPNYSIVDTWNYVESIRGPRRSVRSIPLAVCLTVINGVIFVSGLLGNAAVCLVIMKHPNMRTATNYYLFNLAVSDLTLLIFGLPYDVNIFWNQYPWTLGVTFCQIRALMSEMASYVSVLTIVAFSTERYLSICYPLYMYQMSGLQRAVKIITGLWLFSFIAALPFSFYTSVNYINYPPTAPKNGTIEESAFCALLDIPAYLPLGEISSLVFFIIPMVVIIFEYAMMGIKILNRSDQSLGQNNSLYVHRDNRKTNKAIIRMLAAVVVGFFISWAPFHMQRLWYWYAIDSPNYHLVNEWLFIITGMFYYFSSTLNPILYNIMSNRYRNAFRKLLCGGSTTSLHQRNDTLMRTSTVRETRIPSHSTCDRHDVMKVKKYNKKCANRTNNHHDDEMSLMLQVCANNKKGGTLIYQLENNGSMKSNCETCI